jgi:hypothetical protein
MSKTNNSFNSWHFQDVLFVFSQPKKEFLWIINTYRGKMARIFNVSIKEIKEMRKERDEASADFLLRQKAKQV